MLKRSFLFKITSGVYETFCSKNGLNFIIDLYYYQGAFCNLKPGLQFLSEESKEKPRCEKTCLRDFRPGPTLTGLYCEPQKIGKGLKFRILIGRSGIVLSV